MVEKRSQRRRRLSERRAEMPIIDVARAPIEEVRSHWPGKGAWMFAWLRVLRPLALIIFWLVMVRYAWHHFFGMPDDLPVAQQIALYGVAVLVIVLAMLALAPLRRREVRREPAATTEPASLDAMSEFGKVSPHELSELQQAQRVVVHHDDEGLLHSAEDTGKLLRGK